MSINFLLNTLEPQNIKIPSIHIDKTSNIPFVPNPYSGVKFQMGGVTPSYDSINNSKRFHSNKIYQFNAPHMQNSLTPCSVIGNKQSDSTKSRRCYNIYSSGQNIVGEVCTTPGVDEQLYSNKYTFNNNPDVNGNADWVRGNNFGVRYNSSMINDRTKYILNTPSLKENNKTYVNYDKFYPDKSIDNVNNYMNKSYPYINNYTKNGYPTWKYPYYITQLKSSVPTEIISRNYINDGDIIDTSENFLNINDNNINKRVYFWIGIVAIILSLLYFNIFFKRIKKK